MIQNPNINSPAEVAKFGGPLDLALGSVAVGALVYGEYTPVNSLARYVAAGVAAVAGLAATFRMIRAEHQQ